jgi:hypothetical protein
MTHSPVAFSFSLGFCRSILLAVAGSHCKDTYDGRYEHEHPYRSFHFFITPRLKFKNPCLRFKSPSWYIDVKIFVQVLPDRIFFYFDEIAADPFF